MKNNDLKDFKIDYAGIIAQVIILLILYPVLRFGCAYVGGLILKTFVGTQISSGLNLWFNTTRFTPDTIPIAVATLAVFGGYFRSSSKTSSKKKNDNA